MLIILFVLFAILTFLYFIDIKNKNVINIILIVFGVIFILFAGLRAKDMDNDYYVYRDYWRTRKLLGDVEYSFYIIREFVKNTLNLNFQYLLLIYAFLGVSIKFAAIRRFAPALWGSLLVYLSHYFLLHEFTQIRIGVATGFLLFSIYFIGEKNFVLYFISAILAILFHQSCVLVLAFLLIRNSEKNVWLFSLLIPLGYIFYFLNTHLNINIPIPGLQSKIEMYEEATKSGFLKDSKINAFNFLFLIRVFIFYALFFYSNKISPYFTKFYIFFKIYALSLFSFLFFSKIPVFSFRIQELLGVVEIILIPTVVYIFSEKYKVLGRSAVCLIALGLLLLNIYYVKLIIVK